MVITQNELKPQPWNMLEFPKMSYNFRFDSFKQPVLIMFTYLSQQNKYINISVSRKFAPTKYV